MITGDHKNTAVAIARELGFFGEDSLALTGRGAGPAQRRRSSKREVERTCGLCPRFARAQAEGGPGLAQAGRRRGHDRGRRQRRAGGQGSRHRRGHGHHRDGRHQGSLGHDHHRRQFRLDRRRGRGRPGDLRQHQEVHPLSSLLQHAARSWSMFIASLVGLPVPCFRSRSSGSTS